MVVVLVVVVVVVVAAAVVVVAVAVVVVAAVEVVVMMINRNQSFLECGNLGTRIPQVGRRGRREVGKITMVTIART
jgi:hypothetical protein